MQNTSEDITLVSHEDVDRTMLFTRTTSYANSTDITSSSKVVIKSRKKIAKQRKPRKPRKITPAKSIITKLPAYPSIKNFLVKKSESQAIIPFRISSKSDSYVSKYANYPTTEDDPTPGDLVMASAGDIGLREFKNGEMKRNELVFGIAKMFTYVNHMIEYENEQDNFMVKDLELLKVVWSIKPGRRIAHPIDMQRMYTKVVSKRNDPDMLDVSNFVKKEAQKHFYFGIPEGWMGVDIAIEDVEDVVVEVKKEEDYSV